MMPGFESAEAMNAVGRGYLPGLVGVEFTAAGSSWVEARIRLAPHHLAPNGYLHAASVIALADTACGYGCVRALPQGARGFTTVELKANFQGTALDGVVSCRAEARHLGRTTQIWDADVRHDETGKTIALFRCTQMVLWPK